MKKTLLGIAILFTLGATAQSRYEQTDRYEDRNRRYEKKNRHQHIDSYQRQARMAIAAGITNGQINSNEAKRLLKFAERIEIKENAFVRDGLNRREREELYEDLADLNRRIRQQRRDEDSRYDKNDARSRQYDNYKGRF